MQAKTLMVQGTASSVGKSLLVAAFCRLLRAEGLRVAPFKAQNMALNAAVAAGGGEVGRAQAVQAEAAGVPVTVDMNPVLLKPEGDSRSQVVVLGRPWGRVEGAAFRSLKPALADVVAGALGRLRAAHDVVVIEGAGSPAEVNLKDGEIVNMHVARLADAPVLLVGDIDRGGVLASLVGTLELLEPDERGRIAGLVINKFRGDRSLLEPGLAFLERRTGLPVLGVLPYLRDLRISDEDSVSLESLRRRRRPPPDLLDVAVIDLPRLSNQDDLDALLAEPGVEVRLAAAPAAVAEADLVLLPGSKSTAADLAWLRAGGLDAALVARAAAGGPILGICGGCEMLGRAVHDPEGVEAAPSQEPLPGLGLLPVVTRFRRDKTTSAVRARVAAAGDGLLAGASGEPIVGYEIHAGAVEPASDGRRPAFTVVERDGRPCEQPDGAVAGSVVGTMIHGVLNHDGVRATLLAALRRRRGLPTPATPPARLDRQAEYDRLADAVRAHCDWPRVRRIAGL